MLKLPVLDAHACSEARTPPVNECVSDALLNAAMQNVLQALSHNIPVMLNNVSSTQKYFLS